MFNAALLVRMQEAQERARLKVLKRELLDRIRHDHMPMQERVEVVKRLRKVKATLRSLGRGQSDSHPEPETVHPT